MTNLQVLCSRNIMFVEYNSYLLSRITITSTLLYSRTIYTRNKVKLIAREKKIGVLVWIIFLLASRKKHNILSFNSYYALTIAEICTFAYRTFETLISYIQKLE